MPIERDKIFVGDTYAIEYESLIQTGTFSETPVNPSSAYVELWDVQNQRFVSLGTVGANGVGAAATVSGNIISFLLTSTYTATAGDYKVFVTVTYPDGQVVTDVRLLKIQSRT